ncbi:MAG: hypothetical protein AB3N11_01925 [Arenibacterium sp.]
MIWIAVLSGFAIHLAIQGGGLSWIDMFRLLSAGLALFLMYRASNNKPILWPIGSKGVYARPGWLSKGYVRRESETRPEALIVGLPVVDRLFHQAFAVFLVCLSFMALTDTSGASAGPSMTRAMLKMLWLFLGVAGCLYFVRLARRLEIEATLARQVRPFLKDKIFPFTDYVEAKALEPGKLKFAKGIELRFKNGEKLRVTAENVGYRQFLEVLAPWDDEIRDFLAVHADQLTLEQQLL